MRENHRLKAEHTRLCNADLAASIEYLSATLASRGKA